MPDALDKYSMIFDANGAHVERDAVGRVVVTFPSTGDAIGFLQQVELIGRDFHRPQPSPRDFDRLVALGNMNVHRVDDEPRPGQVFPIRPGETIQEAAQRVNGEQHARMVKAHSAPDPISAFFGMLDDAAGWIARKLRGR